MILGLQDRETRDRAAEWMEGPEADPALRLWRALCPALRRPLRRARHSPAHPRGLGRLVHRGRAQCPGRPRTSPCGRTPVRLRPPPPPSVQRGPGPGDAAQLPPRRSADAEEPTAGRRRPAYTPTADEPSEPPTAGGAARPPAHRDGPRRHRGASGLRDAHPRKARRHRAAARRPAGRGRAMTAVTRPPVPPFTVVAGSHDPCPRTRSGCPERTEGTRTFMALGAARPRRYPADRPERSRHHVWLRTSPAPGGPRPQRRELPPVHGALICVAAARPGDLAGARTADRAGTRRHLPSGRRLLSRCQLRVGGAGTGRRAGPAAISRRPGPLRRRRCAPPPSAGPDPDIGVERVRARGRHGTDHPAQLGRPARAAARRGRARHRPGRAGRHRRRPGRARTARQRP